MPGLLSFLILVGLIVMVGWSLNTLAEVRRGQDDILRRLDRLEATLRGERSGSGGPAA